MLEATCRKCGETFNPDSPTDLEHIQTAAGAPCGGLGGLVGEVTSGPNTSPVEVSATIHLSRKA